VTTPANRFAPKCAHPGCSAWASWGYGCTKEIGSGCWYCFAHRPSDEAPFETPPVAAPQGEGLPDEMPKLFAGGLF